MILCFYSLKYQGTTLRSKIILSIFVIMTGLLSCERVDIFNESQATKEICYIKIISEIGSGFGTNTDQAFFIVDSTGHNEVQNSDIWTSALGKEEYEYFELYSQIKHDNYFLLRHDGNVSNFNISIIFLDENKVEIDRIDMFINSTWDIGLEDFATSDDCYLFHFYNGKVTYETLSYVQ